MFLLFSVMEILWTIFLHSPSSEEQALDPKCPQEHSEMYSEAQQPTDQGVKAHAEQK